LIQQEAEQEAEQEAARVADAPPKEVENG